MNSSEYTKNPFNTRFYNQDPATVTPEQVATHAKNHKGFGWNKQIDPRWTIELQKLYNDVYEAYDPTA